MKSNFTPLAVL